ncbi:hypothetical protein GC105_09085 [Alkalibaculum sp. M08DMB]|uniref:Phage tail protein n=1 Tax=Alkalibaculum sporogenes TaxID=2655001 RepID=A0A6A7KA75_9FIRM|nr:DUF6711 family protein [Alkalibaculum sporogenes]MPW25943.1 hypothetical protein [Alkalibaculum sporogenes]
MAMITIGGTALPNPSEYSVVLQDIDSENTKRSETARLSRERLRAGVYKIEIGWIGLTRAQLKLITDALKPAKVSVQFFDPTSASNPTAQMYAGDRTGKLNTYLQEGAQSYWDINFSLTEY